MSKVKFFTENGNNRADLRSALNPDQIKTAILSDGQMVTQPEIKSNSDVLNILLDDVKPISFQEIVYPEITGLWKRINEETDDDEKGKIAAKIKQFRVTDRQKYVVIIEELLRLATVRRWGICKNAAFVYLFNGSFWSELDKKVLQKFLGDSTERMNMPMYDARQYIVREHLFKQFLATGFQAIPESSNKILINLRNGTFEINGNGKRGFKISKQRGFSKISITI